MKVKDLLFLGGNLIKVMSENGIRPSDIRYVQMFTDYQSMRNDGEKFAVCIAVLSSKYDISERTVTRLINRLSRDVSL
jgi:hypothetical protein